MMELKITRSIIAATILVFALATGINSCYYDNEEELYPNTFCDTLNISFSEDIQPKLNNQCLACHQPPFPSGGVDLSNYQTIKVIADSGRLFGSLNHENSFSPMPQGSEKWNDCNLAIMRIWIEEGSQNN